jgi:hypothetical protein
MRRRAFLALVGGAAAAWPFPTYAQERVKVIGWISAIGLDDVQTDARLAALHRGLRKLGLTVETFGSNCGRVRAWKTFEKTSPN